MAKTYDAIVIGARAGGAPTAMLLARRGYDVLLVDKATFPSDTISTHFIHPSGIAALARWGVLDEVRALGAPPVTEYQVDFGHFRIKGAPRPTTDGVAEAYAPRRVLLDDVLVRAAAAAGAEVREGFDVQRVGVDAGTATVEGRTRAGGTVTESARVVIGADGRHSPVAQAAGAAPYLERPTYAATYFAYWSGVEVSALEVFVRPARSFGAFPTDDGLTLVVMSWPRSELKANRQDVEGTFHKALQLAPTLAARIADGTRETRFVGIGDVPGFYRTPYGQGWALVGDARHHKDPCTARGMSDAFSDAEALTAALDQAWSGAAPYEASLAQYQRRRDQETLPMYDFTCQLASLEPPPPQLAQLLAATSASPDASRDFVSILAGTFSVSDFMAPDNVARIMGTSAAVASR